MCVYVTRKTNKNKDKIKIDEIDRKANNKRKKIE